MYFVQFSKSRCRDADLSQHSTAPLQKPVHLRQYVRIMPLHTNFFLSWQQENTRLHDQTDFDKTEVYTHSTWQVCTKVLRLWTCYRMAHSEVRCGMGTSGYLGHHGLQCSWWSSCFLRQVRSTIEQKKKAAFQTIHWKRCRGCLHATLWRHAQAFTLPVLVLYSWLFGPTLPKRSEMNHGAVVAR